MDDNVVVRKDPALTESDVLTYSGNI